MKRRERPRLGVAVIGSSLVHASVFGIAWAASAGGQPPAPQMRVYAVDIVSPPPNVAGELPPDLPEPGEPSPEPVSAAPEPTPAPPAEPEPVPAPAPPKPAPPKPEPARETAPAKAAPPKPAPAKEAAAKPAAATPPAAKPPAPSSSAPGAKSGTSGTGSGTAKAVPGPNPVASSAGGAGLNVRTEGAVFADQAYLINIVYRVKRYFRRPQNARNDRAEVCFRIERNGAASDIRIAEASGSPAFKLAVMEAVEQAGTHREFGPLPAAYTADFLPVCLDIQPDR